MVITRNRALWLFTLAGTLAAGLLAGCGGPATVGRPSDEPVDIRKDPAKAGRTAVKVAEEFIGTRYRNGGTTTDGVDCSGLSFAVYRRLGVKLPRTSREQARTGSHVDRGDLRAGDLVFFGSGSVSHVGIYADDGEFIHASTRARSVRYDRLDDKYFRKRYIGARRVL
ncbi:MAG TPA: C40 family peptidase [Candidatus Krumholzibacteria bacterium]|nr:C40 family peptidase [Candidatus Krumholzibacteria bacterium]